MKLNSFSKTKLETNLINWLRTSACHFKLINLRCFSKSVHKRKDFSWRLGN